VDERIQPLGAVAWAAVEKEPWWTTEALLTNLRWRSRYQDYHLMDAELLDQIRAPELNHALRSLIREAEQLVRAIPRRLPYGCLLRPDGSLAQPDPDLPETLADLVVHHGSRKGAWPSSPEIGSVMLRERR
jgi:hypothetical protein